MSMSDVLRDLDGRMKKSVEAAQHDFATLRTGRANPALLDSLKVDYYGTTMPLNQLGTVTTPEARLLVIQPYDKGAMTAIEKAIQKSDLGLSPSNDGVVIRLGIPPLTQERRKEFVKQLQQKAEAARVSVRNIRRDTLDHLKRDETVTDDDFKRAEKDVQKVADKTIAEIDALAKAKEAELLEG
jgi:ribosome recycling factor